jgi:hypothetical protein
MRHSLRPIAPRHTALLLLLLQLLAARGAHGEPDKGAGRRRLEQVDAELLPELHAVAKRHEGLLEWYTHHPGALAVELGGGGLLDRLAPLLSLLADEGVGHHRPVLPPAEPATDVPRVERCGAEGGASCGLGVPAAAGGHAAAVAGARQLLLDQRGGSCAAAAPSPAAGLDAGLPWYDFVIVVASAPAHFDYRAVMRETWLAPAGLATALRNATAWPAAAPPRVRLLFAVGQVRASRGR